MAELVDAPGLGPGSYAVQVRVLSSVPLCLIKLNFGEKMNQIKRLDHELPQCVVKWGWKYHHLGVPTNEIKENEKYIEFAKVYVSGFSSSPFGVEWMRWKPDSDFHPLVKTVPHLAFVVDGLDLELEKRRLNVIVPPNSPFDSFRAAMIEFNGAPIELMEFCITEHRL